MAPALLGLLGLGGALQPAAAAEGARCSGTLVILLNPGFSVQPSTGTHRSEAPAVLECHGAVDGRPITGTGTLTDEGPYGTDDPDSCMTGTEGTGLDRLVVPTADGPQTIDSHYTYTAAKAENGGPFNGRFEGSRYSGTFEFRILEGDCVSAPITKVELRIDGILK